MSNEVKFESPIDGIKWLDMFGSVETARKTILQADKEIESHVEAWRAASKAVDIAHDLARKELYKDLEQKRGLQEAKKNAAKAALAEAEIAAQ